jgi:membrane-associated protein
MFNALADYVSGAWWSYALIFGLAYFDAIIPLVPSETAVITGGVLSASGDMILPLIIVVAAAGAFCGDNTAYLIGRHFGEPVKRRFFKGQKAKERMDWAEHQLDDRGAELIVVARFIPGGRTAVTLSAGGMHWPWPRFAVADAVASVIWATYASLIGYFGGKTFENQPWKGLLLALVIAFAVAGGIELVRWLLRRRRARRATQPEAE